MSVNNIQNTLLSALQGGGGRGESIESLYQKSAIGDSAANTDSLNELRKLLEQYRQKEPSKDVNYTKLKDSAQAVRGSAEKLTGTGSESLFAKAAASGDTKEVVSEVNKFVENYNKMLTALKSTPNEKSEAQLEQLYVQTAVKEEILGKAGIIVNEDGTLAVNEAKLKEADLETLKRAFNGSSSFMSKIKTRSVYVEANAARNERMEATGIYGKGGAYSRYLSEDKYGFYNTRN